MHSEYIRRISWEEVNDYLNMIAGQIDSHEYSGVYGVPRGGLVLAAWLSHKLYLPLLFEPNEKCIVIDDICDSGDGLINTLCYYGIKPKNSCFITSMFKGEHATVDYLDYCHDTKKDNWIAFPWEQ